MFLKVTDNYIAEDVFKRMQHEVLGNLIPWYAESETDISDDDNPRFVHSVYENCEPQSRIYEMLKPVFAGTILLKCKINCDWRKEIKKEGIFHEDCSIVPEYRTGILFFNTNNGYTEFEDGTIVESVENRFIEFDGKFKHRGVSQTDKHFRYVLNLNFIRTVDNLCKENKDETINNGMGS